MEKLLKIGIICLSLSLVTELIVLFHIKKEMNNTIIKIEIIKESPIVSI